ncbi:mitochondrial 2-oxoglutarate/malate carrier protein-like [Colias croceus]|uniref:mitochondrial 2-oxoglutarate/malate carrier protein-like n=1 Tax=Colias crocea TaxID=72248 RepID=UPI001E2805FE|nr:mitochondrial 2-oxoglutarate/malate carrier protein-like [Colias croceus]
MGDKAAPKTIPGWLNFLIGGLSGMLANVIVQPADLVKTRMQLAGPKSNSSVGTIASEILRKEGVTGFYTGLSASLFRQATYTTARLGCFNALFDYYQQNHGTPNFGAKILLGCFAGGVGAVFGNPSEVALIRMTADGRLPPEQRRNYSNVFNALSRIIKEEGAGTLMRGVTATVTRAMVVNGAQLSSYAQSREALIAYMGDGMPLHAVCAMISGLITSAASLPVDIVKTRVQNATKGASQVTVLMSVIKNEGVLALWSGFLPTYAKIGPHTIFTFIFLEQLKAMYFKMN